MNLAMLAAVQKKRRAALISGAARPGNLLTSSRAGQWKVNGAAVPGAAGSTWLVPYDYDINPGDLITQGSGSNTLSVVSYDTDAATVIAAVITAGGVNEWGSTAAHRANNKWRRDDMVIAMKAASLFTGFKYRVMAGTNTVAGGIAAGNGGAATNFNFVSGNISSTLGWLGNGTTKYIDTTWAGNANGQDDMSLWVYVTQACTATGMAYMGTTASGVGSSNLTVLTASLTSTFRNNGNTGAAQSGSIAATGFIGVTRNNGTTFDARSIGLTATLASVSDGTTATTFKAFQRGGTFFSDGRIAAFGTGPACTLATLNTIISAYMAGILS